MPALVRRYGFSEKWIRIRLDQHEVLEYIPEPRQMVAIGDATKIGEFWFLVIRDPNAHENVYFKEVFAETTSSYQLAREDLERQGIIFTAFVGDGRVAVPWLFSDIPVQMCHFHQEQIIVRYTTLHPELPAGQDYPELNIPNTTNSLDGSFKKLKTAIAVHTGLTRVRKIKLITTLLIKRG